MTALPFDLVALGEGEVALAHEDDDVTGMVVLDAGGHRVGEVDDIVVDDQERRARLLVVTSGGVLGLGAQRRLVPVEAVARVSDHVRLYPVDAAALAGDAHDPAQVAPADYAAVYRDFGCTPSWEPGHPTPYFHDRRW